MKNIIVVGAGGFGRELAEFVLDAAARQSEIRLKGFLDDNPNMKAEIGRFLGVEVIGDTHAYAIQENDQFLISLGDPELRKLLSERLAGRGGKFFTLIPLSPGQRDDPGNEPKPGRAVARTRRGETRSALRRM